MGVKFLVLTLLAICACCMVSSEKNVVCYYGTWATYRWGNGKFDVDHVNPQLCTHLVYAFVGINNQGTVISLDPFLDLPDNWGKNNFGKFNALKQKNPKLKTLLAVGGWNEGSGKYSVMAANTNLRKNFISSALSMVQTYGFDGFDLDWEYPSRRDSVHGQADIDNFSKLVKELKEEFQKYGLQVTAAVSSVGPMASLSYDIPTICQYLDLVNLMTYDFYGAWDPVTGHNAGLHKGEGDGATPRENLYTVDVAVEYWLEKGCPPEKLVIGLPFYGRSFTLSNANVNGVGAPASGAGIAGPFTVAAGSLGYNEFCDIMQTQSGWEVRYDELAKVPYAVNGRNWVSFDHPKSLTEKVEWGLTKNVSGMMLWSIETDDFNGRCGEDYPLLRAINRALGRNVDGNDEEISTTEGVVTATAATVDDATETTKDSTTTEATTIKEYIPTVESTEGTTTTTSDPTESDDSATGASTTVPTESEEEDLDEVCSVEGIVPHPYSCSQFLMCVRNGRGGFDPVEFDCPPQTQFDPDRLYCDYSSVVMCSV